MILYRPLVLRKSCCRNDRKYNRLNYASYLGIMCCFVFQKNRKLLFLGGGGQHHQIIHTNVMRVAVTKLQASRPGRTSRPLACCSSTATLALLRCEFWRAITRLGAAVRAATVHRFVVTLKHAIWWRLLQLPDVFAFLEGFASPWQILISH
jgi:hypothetical protein